LTGREPQNERADEDVCAGVERTKASKQDIVGPKAARDEENDSKIYEQLFKSSASETSCEFADIAIAMPATPQGQPPQQEPGT
jgi:hypothetical protein